MSDERTRIRGRADLIRQLRMLWEFFREDYPPAFDFTDRQMEEAGLPDPRQLVADVGLDLEEVAELTRRLLNKPTEPLPLVGQELLLPLSSALGWRPS